jgi:hypothetical protein
MEAVAEVFMAGLLSKERTIALRPVSPRHLEEAHGDTDPRLAHA